MCRSGALPALAQEDTSLCHTGDSCDAVGGHLSPPALSIPQECLPRQMSPVCWLSLVLNPSLVSCHLSHGLGTVLLYLPCHGMMAKGWPKSVLQGPAGSLRRSWVRAEWFRAINPRLLTALCSFQTTQALRAQEWEPVDGNVWPDTKDKVRFGGLLCFVVISCWFRWDGGVVSFLYLYFSF